MARSLLIRPPNVAAAQDNGKKLKLKPHSFGIGGFVAENVQEASSSDMVDTSATFDEARAVIRHYGGTRGDHTPLRLLERESTINIVAAKRENRLLVPPGIMMVTTSSMEKVRLTPAELCYSVLTSHILPVERSTKINAKDVSNTIHLVGLTIQALSRESKAGKGFRLGGEGDAASFLFNNQRRDPLRNAKLVDECLRRLVTVEVQVPSLLDFDRTCYIMTKLYNMAMSSWAVAASSTNTGAGPVVSREAALRAERLLLEMANAGAGQADLGDEWLGMKSPKQQGESVMLMDFVRPDTVSFNTVISAWTNSLRQEQGAGGDQRNTVGRKIQSRIQQEEDNAAERADAILQLMVDLRNDDEGDNADGISRVCPNALSFGLVMQAWSRWGQSGQSSAIKNIEGLLEQMKQQSIVANPRIYSTILSSYSKANLPDAVERADRLVADIPKEHMNTIVYNSLVGIHAVDKKRSWSDRYKSCERIDEIINDMSASDECFQDEEDVGFYKSAPDQTTFGTALMAWALLAKDAANAPGSVSLKNRRRCAERSRHCLNELIHMRRHCDGASRVSLHYVNDILSAYGAARMPLEAEELLQYVKNNYPITPLPDSTSYGIVIEAHGKTADKLRWLREYEDSIPDIRRRYDHGDGTQQYNAVIDGFCRSQEVDEAEAVLFGLIDRYKTAAEEAKANCDHIIRSPKPNAHSFASIISQLLKQSSREPSNAESYISRIESLVDKMEQLHESTMEESAVPKDKRAKVRPHNIIYNMLISSYSNAEDKLKALSKGEAVLSRMKKNCKPDKVRYSSCLIFT